MINSIKNNQCNHQNFWEFVSAKINNLDEIIESLILKTKIKNCNWYYRKIKDFQILKSI